MPGVERLLERGALDAETTDPGGVLAGALDALYGSPGAMPVDVDRDEIMDLFAELDRQAG